jgi:hypothetical protein
MITIIIIITFIIIIITIVIIMIISIIIVIIIILVVIAILIRGGGSGSGGGSGRGSGSGSGSGRGRCRLMKRYSTARDMLVSCEVRRKPLQKSCGGPGGGCNTVASLRTCSPNVRPVLTGLAARAPSLSRGHPSASQVCAEKFYEQELSYIWSADFPLRTTHLFPETRGRRGFRR